ncbi:heme/hemin ABC transporter substrate-binding protein [Paracoccus albus]|uniref:heme/hemin ABC transporter substrate-binding protein n=1 Tax=Paracoccus albus TaxID=3017784 RepID=UPI0022EFF630|nr:ABC transporter substrate-binding protein [Paracoccus albus]WBU60987.1 ABC transporter substrate-binding protein [Paracoccus albus]
MRRLGYRNLALASTVVSAALISTPSVATEPHPDAKRVLAIGGSITEIVYALGQEDRLVARDTTSSYPAEAQELPDVGYMRALSPEGVLSVKPDLILSQEGAGPPEAIDVLKQAGIPFETIGAGADAERLAEKIQSVADALGVPEAADGPVAKLEADMDKLAQATDEEQRKRVLFILSLQGGRVMAAGQGTEADAIIRLAGADNAVQGLEGYKPLTDEAITAAAPDVILMMNRGETTSDHDAPDDQLFAMPAISTTPAAKTKSVIRMDGLYLLGFGPRTGRAALELHNAIYEDG